MLQSTPSLATTATACALAGASPEYTVDLSPACSPSPRISFSLDDLSGSDPNQIPAPILDAADFEFRPDDAVAMLPADELFSGGKLVPLHSRPDPRPSEPRRTTKAAVAAPLEQFDPSPRAPTCASHWRELLSLRKRLHSKPPETQKSPNPSPVGKNSSNFPKSLRISIRRSPRSDPAVSTPRLPLLRDSSSSSSSSSSSGVDPDEIQRLKPSPGAAGRRKVRVRSPRVGAAAAESPRMISSGKVVFRGLERSSSGGCTGGVDGGGVRIQVRVKPVLNVPIYTNGKSMSVLGFGIAGSAGAGGKKLDKI